MRLTLKHLAIAVVALSLSMGAASQASAQAPAPEQLGQVNFPVSCAGEAPAKFHRAMALYHSFDWKRGKAAFAEIASLDPRCGMAYWGLAMIAADNPFGWPVSLKGKEGAEAIQKAKDVGAATPRERDYIAALAVLYNDHETVPHRQRALAYEQAMEKLAARYPDDVEATILYALTVSANHDPNDKTFARPLKAAALLEPLFAAYPYHPAVAHYLIHSYDYPSIAAKGLGAAKRYAEVAPDASHARHMPSHIFTRVGAWRESVASNQASVVAAKGDMRFIPHGWDYMVYAYLQLADDTGADKVGAEARAVGTVSDSSLGEVFGMTAIPSRLALERGRWADASALERPASVSESAWKRFPQAEAINAYARALGAARSGEAAGARREIERLNKLQQVLAERKLAYWAEQVEIQAQVATAWALYAEGRHEEALATMRAAADHEDRTEKHVVTPGPIMPARELLGDMLMELGRPADALPQYEASIAKEPNRFRGLYGAGLAAERAGDQARARGYFEKLVAMSAPSNGARTELAHAKQVLAQR
ncbi:MAG TPA: tetratricopeptide repeat protein [Candidatus Tectomicrobia bacterium]|nr:tetratricopeptide repeat protein [Candidatus Tectomicrobia bacterium]